ncbi:putative dual oxidase [Arapaima gigas]
MFTLADKDGIGSFIEISSCCLSKSQAEKAIQATVQAADFNTKEHVNWEDFHFLLRDHENELQFALVST